MKIEADLRKHLNRKRMAFISNHTTKMYFSVACISCNVVRKFCHQRNAKLSSILRIRPENKRQFSVLWHTISVAKKFVFVFVYVSSIVVGFNILKHVVYIHIICIYARIHGALFTTDRHRNSHSKDTISYVRMIGFECLSACLPVWSVWQMRFESLLLFFILNKSI